MEDIKQMMCCDKCKSFNLTFKKEPVFDCIIYICNDCKYPSIIERDNVLYRKIKIEKIINKCIT